MPLSDEERQRRRKAEEDKEFQQRQARMKASFTGDMYADYQLQLSVDPPDVKFTFPNNQGADGQEDPVSLPVHKSVLIMRSPVFARMFGDGSAFSEATGGEVVITDHSPVVFKIFVTAMYGRAVDRRQAIKWARLYKLSEDEINFSLLSLAHRYEATSILEALVPDFQTCYTVENICTYLRLAYMYRIKSLVQACHTYIQNKCHNDSTFHRRMCATAAFLSLDKEVVVDLLNAKHSVKFEDFAKPEVAEETDKEGGDQTDGEKVDESNPAKRRRT